MNSFVKNRSRRATSSNNNIDGSGVVYCRMTPSSLVTGTFALGEVSDCTISSEGWLPISLTASTESYILHDDARTRLQRLYKESGLTWQNLATVFGITPRMIHFWQTEERPIGPEHQHLIGELLRLLGRLEELPIFQIRNFLEENLLKDKARLGWLRKGDYRQLQTWIRTVRVDAPYFPAYDISPQELRDRLPPRTRFTPPPSEVEPIQPKTHKAKIVRPLTRKRPTDEGK